MWLARRKVIIPDRPVGALDRPLLVGRCDPALHRVVVLMAPGGFGKTVLLGECCRRAQDDGRLVAWVTTDEHDDPETLVSYLALAFAESGAEFELDDAVSHPDSQRYRLDALLHWIGTIDGEVVIALDEVDRLEPASVALVDYLVWRGPANLHLAMAFRTRPRGLDIATPILEGRGMVISTDELRFQRQDIARYFDTNLSRDQLRSLWEDSHGWPLAVCVQRNVADRFAEPTMVGEVSLNWVETRLFRGLSSPDRDFILEVGLFEWADDDLLERVLKGGAPRRLRSLTPLVGLVQEVADGSFRLHPLLRRYAADALWRNARRRFRSIGASRSCSRNGGRCLRPCSMRGTQRIRAWSVASSSVRAASGSASGTAWVGSTRPTNWSLGMSCVGRHVLHWQIAGYSRRRGRSIRR